VVACLLFAVTYLLDVAAAHGHLRLPWFIRIDSADAGREVLTSIAAAVITVVGVVFSITIVGLILASQQFGPRMMRYFVRDMGNQITLGMFVSTFVYSVLALASISSGPKGTFVPQISITVSELLLLADLAVLIYFIHHIAKSIQLPEVIAGIAQDLLHAIDAEFPDPADSLTAGSGTVPTSAEARILERLETRGGVVPATSSGYLQFIGYGRLVVIAEKADAVIRLSHRPGHFVVAGRPLARVWPPEAATEVGHALARSHIAGPHRTLTQDPVFAIDQLVEIAIRALSAAVNDTFTALTCIDWLCAGLCRISGRVLAEGLYFDRKGKVRLVGFDPSYTRIVDRAFDKVRQSGGAMPAVVIRLLDSLANIMEHTTTAHQRDVLLRQANMILSGAEASISEKHDLDVIRGRYERVRRAIAVVEELG
jgi:uncharacterized membrane protein